MKVIRQLTHKIMKDNKKLTISILLSIILSTTLLFSVGLGFSSFWKSILDNTIYSEGDHHVRFDEVKFDYRNKLAEFDVVKYKYYFKEKVTYLDDNFIDFIGANNEFYEDVTLKTGRTPINNSEIIVPQSFLTNNDLRLNNSITLTFENDIEKTYTIVGTYESFNYLANFNYRQSEIIYTYKDKFKGDELVSFLVYFSKINKEVINKVEVIALDLGLKRINNPFNPVSFENMLLNAPFLELYGAGYNYQELAVLVIFITIISTVLAISCFFVIYNSIAISINERKKLYGILSSIGATSKQIFRSVFYEATILSIIGITIGFLLSLGLVKAFIHILNDLLVYIIDINIVFYIHPLFMVFSLFFIIASIFLSTLFPASRAKEITPIEAIKQTKDIKIKSKKIKVNKLITKLFGIESVIARKNLKRNKSKYRTTIISLFISVTMFITLSMFLNMILFNLDNALTTEFDYNIFINHSLGDKEKEVFKKHMNTLKEPEEMIFTTMLTYRTDSDALSYYTDKQLQAIKEMNDHYEREFDSSSNVGSSVTLVKIDRKNYNKIKKENKLTKDQPLLLNYNHISILEVDWVTNLSETITLFDGKYIKEDVELKFNICSDKFAEVDGRLIIEEGECNYLIDDIYLLNKIPFSFVNKIQSHNVIIIAEDMFTDLPIDTIRGYLRRENEYHEIYIQSKDYVDFDSSFKKIIDLLDYSAGDEEGNNIYYSNEHFEFHQARMAIKGLKLVLYSVVAFIVLIAITSVFSTISNSLNLRKKEFAILRSVGLSPKGFDKIIHYESLAFSLKSLLFSIPASIGVINLIFKTMDLDRGVNKIKYPYPTIYIIISIIGVLLVVFITMKYAAKKIKNDNVVDTLKDQR